MGRTTGRRRAALSTLALAGLLLTVASAALAVDVRGTLRVPSDYGAPAAESDEESRRNRYWEEWNGFIDPRDPSFDASRELAVVLTGEGAMAEEQPGFKIANGGLWPATMVERAGATLRIQNTDPMAHQLSAEGHSEFTPTPTSPGLTRQLLVSEAGAWPVRDQLYAHVRGHLHVLPDLVARARIDADGSYQFRNVPPGTYTLKIFHGERQIHEQAGVEVTDTRELTLEPIAVSAGGS